MGLFSKFKKPETKKAGKEIKAEIVFDEASALEKLSADISKEERITLLEKLGMFYSSQKNISKAIEHLEERNKLDKSLSPVQGELLRLYNAARKECVEAGQAEEAERYMNKIEDLMKQSKDTIRYGVADE